MHYTAAMASRPLSAELSELSSAFLSLVCYFPQLRWARRKTAGAAGQSQYGKLRTTTAGAGSRTGDGGKDFANARDLGVVQERRRLAGDSGAWRETPRKDAQVFDRWETGRVKVHDATGEAPEKRSDNP